MKYFLLVGVHYIITSQSINNKRGYTCHFLYEEQGVANNILENIILTTLNELTLIILSLNRMMD